MKNWLPITALLFPLLSHASNELSVDIGCEDMEEHFNDCVAGNHENALNRVEVLNQLLLSGIETRNKPKFYELIDAWGDSMRADCDVEDEGFEKTNCEYIGATSRAYVLAHIVARHSKMESVGDVLSTAKRHLQDGNIPEPTENTVPVRHEGKAPGKDNDFKLIEAQVDMTEITDALDNCPADREAEPEKQQACMAEAALVVSSWIYKAGFSVDAMMVKAHNNGKGSSYWPLLSRKMGDTLVAITTAIGSQVGRDALVNNGYLKRETAAMFAAHVGKGN